MSQPPPNTPNADTPPTPVTIRTLQRMAAQGEPFACLTCYDATTARWLRGAGVHVLLVGDTAAEVILGFDSTVHMPLDISLALTAAVKRGAPDTFVMGDMPFMSYQASDEQAMLNAGRYITEGRADCVKLEADASLAPLVAKMARAGIPVCAHVGSKPQQSGLTGGYASAGRTTDAAQRVLDDAEALEEAGAVMLLVEAVPEEVAAQVVQQSRVPVIGIGAGPAPHGQILVLHDLLGLTAWQPGFAPRLANIGHEIEAAAQQFVNNVANRTVTEHRYSMLDGQSKPRAAQG